MRSSRRIILSTVAILAVLFTIAVENEMSGRYQILPFSSWSLFSKHPPRDQVDYGLRLISIDGEELETPVYFESAGRPGSTVVAAFELIQDLGQAIEREQPLRADHAWTTLSGRYLGAQEGRVEVVRREYDVLDRRECECFEVETVIATLEVGR